MNCELSIENIDELRAAWRGTNSFTASGKVLSTLIPAKAIPFEIKITKLYRAVYQQLVSLSNANLADQAAANDPASVSFPVEIYGFDENEDVYFDAVFAASRPLTKESFIDSRNYQIVLRLIKI